jgi:hypothetical protein
LVRNLPGVFVAVSTATLLSVPPALSAEAPASWAVPALVSRHYPGFLAGLLVGVVLAVALFYLVRRLREIRFPATEQIVTDLLKQAAAHAVIIVAIVGSLFGVVLFGAVVTGHLDAIRFAIAVLAGGAALVAVSRAAEVLAKGGRIELQSNWGGLGGGLGGWSLSPAAGLVLLVLILTSVAIVAVVPKPPDQAGETRKGDKAANASVPGESRTLGASARPAAASNPKAEH